MGTALWALALPGSPDAAAQLAVTAQGAGAYLTHRVDVGLGVEETTGIAYGGQGMLRVGPWLELGGHGVTGTLTPQTGNAVERSVTELGAVASVTAVPWIAFQVGATVRGYTAELATQRWVQGRVGAELRLPFVNGAFLGTVGGGLMPVVSVNGLEDPDVALYAGAGLRWQAGPVAASVAYGLERFDFPDVGGVARREQVATVRAGLGVRLGR